MNASCQQPGVLSPQPRSWLALVLLSCIGGTTFLWINLALFDLDPLWLVAFRISLAAVIMSVVWWCRGGQLFKCTPRRSTLVWVVAISILTTVLPFVLISWGQQYVATSSASIAVASSALMVLPLAHFLVPGERINARSILGLALGFFGVVFVIGPTSLASSNDVQLMLGEFACLLAAGCYALSSIFISRLPAVDPIGLTAVMLIIATLIVFPTAIIFSETPKSLSLRSLSSLIILAVASTAGSNLLAIGLVRNVGPNFLSLSSYLAPSIAIIAGAVFLGEDISVLNATGFMLILSGVAVGRYGPGLITPISKIRRRVRHISDTAGADQS